ncbi:MAG TPA: radical SAM protein, partial [Smithellaceae bacterium]|nr:radical SAM protein [Smithellaceae bacterium]
MIDVLFVKPNNKKRAYGVLSSELSGIEPPLWAALLAAFIRQHGFSVRIIDAEVENHTPEETAQYIADVNPLLAAIVVSGSNPSASTVVMDGARSILTSLKSSNDRIKTILMGLHPSSLPCRTITEEATDFVCEGEGFQTLASLVAALKNNKSYAEITGLWGREGQSIFHNKRAELWPDLNTLPYAAWDLLPMKKYRAHNWHCFGQLENRTPYAVIYTSLGCPFSCKFCCINAIFGQNTMRRRSPEKVVAEIGTLVNDYHVRNIKIMDEMFVLHKDHVLEICDRIIRKGYDLNMWAYARIDTVSPDLLKQMKKAGINWVGLGIESGNQRILRGINKGITVEKIKNAVQMTHDAGLYIGANYIFGLPDDDDQSMRDTFNLAKELNCEYANFYVAMAYPGSMLYQEAISKGWKLP